MSDNWGIGFFQRLEDQKLEKKMNDKIEELERRVADARETLQLYAASTYGVLDEIKLQLEELKKQEQEEDWPASCGDEGHVFYSYGSTDVYEKRYDERDFLCRQIKAAHMCFHTKEAAELSCKRALAYRMLWELADGGEWMLQKNKGEYYAIEFTGVYGVPKFSTIKKAMGVKETIGTELLDTIFGGEQK